ncbi:hypothetical protein GCM10010446_24420 [Streptomyces enissocaesilis]|uniref:Transposase n=1 Tax=Streptomyces enissocaesilis TaxID=332589 RepID=A0ABN3X6G1_9ACTN
MDEDPAPCDALAAHRLRLDPAPVQPIVTELRRQGEQVAREANEATFRVGRPTATVWVRRYTHEELRHGRSSERALTL